MGGETRRGGFMRWRLIPLPRKVDFSRNLLRHPSRGWRPGLLAKHPSPI